MKTKHKRTSGIARTLAALLLATALIFPLDTAVYAAPAPDAITNTRTGAVYTQIEAAAAAASDGDTLDFSGTLPSQTGTGTSGYIMIDKELTLTCSDGFATVPDAKLWMQEGAEITIGGDGQLNFENFHCRMYGGSLTVEDGATMKGSNSNVIEVRKSARYQGKGGRVVNTYTGPYSYRGCVDIRDDATGVFTGGAYESPNDTLFIRENGRVTSISGTTFTAHNNAGSSKRGAIVNQGVIDEIKSGTFTGKNSGFGMQVMHGGRVGEISGGTFKATGGTAGTLNSDAIGIYIMNGSIDRISGGTFQGSNIGMWVRSDGGASSVGEITGGYFYGQRYYGLSLDAGGSANLSKTTIDSIKNATFSSDGTALFVYGTVGSLENVTCTSRGQAIWVYDDGVIDEIISGSYTNDVTRFSSRGAVEISDGGKINVIHDGTFQGRAGAIITMGTGNVGVIHNGVFYSRDAATFRLSTQTRLEPDLTAPRGIGRYLYDSNYAAPDGSDIIANNIAVPDGYIMSTAKVAVEGETKLYRYLTKKNSEIMVTFDPNGGSGTPDTQYIPYDTATALRANQFTWEGKTFLGWATSENSEDVAYTDGADITATADVTLYALWEDATYTVSYDFTTTAPQGAAPPAAEVVIHGNAATQPTVTPVTGWIFDGWYTDADCTAAYDFATEVTGDTTLYAKWKPVTYQVSYQFAGTAPQGVTPPAGDTVNHGLAATEPAATTAAGWTFEGWYTDEACTQKYDFATEVTGDTTLYGKWEKQKRQVDFRYVSVWPAGAMPPAAVTLTYGDTALEPAVAPVTGWTFEGWYTDEACTQRYDFAGAVTEDLRLYGKWVAAQGDDPTPPTPSDGANTHSATPGSQAQGDVPKTGEQGPGVWYLLAMMALAGAGIVILLKKNGRRADTSHRKH